MVVPPNVDPMVGCEAWTLVLTDFPRAYLFSFCRTIPPLLVVLLLYDVRSQTAKGFIIALHTSPNISPR